MDLLKAKRSCLPMGARLYFGGGGGSSSSANTTNNSDKRLAVGEGAGVSGDGSSIVITDSGIVERALNSIDVTNALAAGSFNEMLNSAGSMFEKSDKLTADGFNKLLDSATSMFNTSEGLIGQTQKSVADAYSVATTDKAGAIDQKTMIVMAVAAAAVVVAVNRKKA